MDRFKFRVWCEVCKAYISPTVVTITHDGDMRAGHYSTYKHEIDIFIEQCTGLKDKNGKLIYEGDIVRYSPKCKGWHVGVMEYRSDLGKWHFGTSYGSSTTSRSYTFASLKKNGIEVIGNIHTTPELLEQQ